MFNKVFEILVIDDDSDISTMFDVIKTELSYEGYMVNLTYMHNYDFTNSDGDSFLVEEPYDIVVFDCSLNASNLMKFKIDNEPEGLSLIKEFRRVNKRTKVILYSGTFDLAKGDLPFNVKQLVSIINEVNIYKIVEKDVKKLMNAIKDSICDIDMILISMEDIYREYKDNNVIYKMVDKDITLSELINQFKTGGKDAEIFREQIIKNILHFMLDFNS